MIYNYVVFLNGEPVMEVRAFSAEDACHQAYMKLGSASKYSGNGRNAFKAYRQ